MTQANPRPSRGPGPDPRPRAGAQLHPMGTCRAKGAEPSGGRRWAGPTLAEALAAAPGGPAPVGDTGNQDADQDSHPQEAEPAQHTGQHRLRQEAW